MYGSNKSINYIIQSTHFQNGWELLRVHNNSYMEREREREYPTHAAVYKYTVLCYNETFLYSLVHSCTLEAHKESEIIKH